MMIVKQLVAAVCASALVGSLLLTGCTTASSESTEASQQNTQVANAQTGAVTFTDDSGAQISVENPQRVVACMGSFANIWELAGGTLVGASDDAFQSYTITSENAAMVGDFSSPNLEAIIALEPDFVLMTSGSGGRGGNTSQEDLKAALEASGITVALFEVTTFDDYLRMLRVCCDITGREDLYQQNGQDVADRIDEIIASVPEGAAPSALLMTTYSGGTRVQASSTQTGAMLADLGVQNLADQNSSLLKDFSLEAMIEMNPEYIFVVPMGNDDEAALKNLEEATAANPAWSTLTAVQNDHYTVLDKHLFLYKPNEKWADAYQTLYDLLYAQ